MDVFDRTIYRQDIVLLETDVGITGSYLPEVPCGLNRFSIEKI